VVTTLAGLAASLALLGFAWIAGRRHLTERERDAVRLLHHHVAKPPDMEKLTAIFRTLPRSFAPSPVP
jgi:hypothetical protein